MLGVAKNVISEADARADAATIVVRQVGGEGAVDRLESLKCAAARLNSIPREQVKIPVVAQAEIERQPRGVFPVVLKIDAEHLGAARQVEIRVTGGRSHADDRARRGEALGVCDLVIENHAWLVKKIEFRRRVELEEAAQFRLPKEVKAGLESVPTPDNREVVAELKLALIGLLRHVNVRAEEDASGESHVRNFLRAVNQVVPVLEADRERVDDIRSQGRIERRAGDLQFVRGEVAARQVVGRARLVVLALVRLRGVTQEGVMLLV